MIHSGSGFFVNNEYIVTNAHVVNGCSTVSIKGAVSEQEAHVEIMDTARDLALVKAQPSDHPVSPMRFDLDNMRAGDKVFIIGYPGIEGINGKYKFIDAWMQALPSRTTGGDNDRFYITDSLEHGESGGPVFDTYGNVIGVVVAKTKLTMTNKMTGQTISEQPLGVVIKLSTLKDFLYSYGVYPEWIGSGSRSVDPYIEEDAKAFIVNIQCRIDAAQTN